jgi:hypothetical protein
MAWISDADSALSKSSELADHADVGNQMPKERGNHQAPVPILDRQVMR